MLRMKSVLNVRLHSKIKQRLGDHGKSVEKSVRNLFSVNFEVNNFVSQKLSSINKQLLSGENLFTCKYHGKSVKKLSRFAICLLRNVLLGRSVSHLICQV